MKIYIYYLTIPESIPGKIDSDELDKFEIVRQTLQEDFIKNKSGTIIDVNGIDRYLYAFTSDKEIAKDFEFIHSMFLFTKLERKMDTEEYALFEKEMDYAKLQYFVVDNFRKRSMLLTKLEHHILEHSFDDLELHLSNYACLGYDFFQQKYIRALDLLLYTVYYQLNGPDSNFYDYNWSYGITPEGASDCGVSAALNFQNMYLHIFKLILK